MTQGPDCPWARPTRYSTRSLRRSRKAAAWAWQSVSRSSNRMADESGPTATAGMARRSTSPCQRLPRKQTVPWMPRDSAFSRVGTRAQLASASPLESDGPLYHPSTSVPAATDDRRRDWRKCSIATDSPASLESKQRCPVGKPLRPVDQGAKTAAAPTALHR